MEDVVGVGLVGVTVVQEGVTEMVAHGLKVPDSEVVALQPSLQTGSTEGGLHREGVQDPHLPPHGDTPCPLLALVDVESTILVGELIGSIERHHFGKYPFQ